MKNNVSTTLLIWVGALFMFNYEICSYYYDVGTHINEWWALRLKIYSFIFTVLGLVLFINVEKRLRIITIPVLAIFLGDFKDRIIFNDATRHWSDILLVLISIIIMILLWRRNDESRE